VNLLERRFNKKQSLNEISNIRGYIYELLKEFKENKVDTDELQHRKDKLMKEINGKLKNKNIRIKFGKLKLN
jgi:seryl-tRNA synthetase